MKLIFGRVKVSDEDYVFAAQFNLCFDYKGYAVAALEGQCSRCERIYWTSENMEWITWLTDEQHMNLILESTGIQHRSCRGWIQITDPCQRIAFCGNGELDHYYQEQLRHEDRR